MKICPELPIGLCSLLDLMLGRSMSEALAGLPLSEPARNAVIGSPNSLRTVLDASSRMKPGHRFLAPVALRSSGRGRSQPPDSPPGAGTLFPLFSRLG